MSITWPYLTDLFTAYQGDVTVTPLSLAVLPVDEYTQETPLGTVAVAIRERHEKPARNLSGYHLFNGLQNGTYTVSVKSDYYFDEELSVPVPRPDPKAPSITITLKPKPAYFFPSHATLVRGVVKNPLPVVGAEVSVVGKPNLSRTDEGGEFVLWFKGIKEENITIQIKKGGNTKTVNVTVKEGKTASVGLVPFP